MSEAKALWHQLVLTGTVENDQQKLETYWVERVMKDAPLDPYLVWASLTRFKFVAPEEPDWFPFVIETTGGAIKLMEAVKVALQGTLSIYKVIKIPAAYRRSLVPGKTYIPSKYITALIHKDYFDWIASFECVVRMQLGVARIGDVDDRTNPYSPEWIVSIPAGYSCTDRAPEKISPVDDQNAVSTVLGVIDDGCSFAHPAYQSGTGTRVVRLWDQSFYAAKWSGKPSYFGYGQVLAKSDLNLYSAGKSESDVYKSVYKEYLLLGGVKAFPSIRLEKATHGTSVMQIFAGRFDPPPQEAVFPIAPTDVCSKADIIFVQLPRPLLDDTASGSMCVYALDALRYIVDRAETYKPIEDADQYRRVIRPIAINLSYGSMSGPHDGTALLDEALSELVELRGNLAVVVAAGNNRKSSCHASMPIPPHGGESHIGVQLSPNNSLVSTLEVWLPKDCADLVKIQLISPSGISSQWIGNGEIHKFRVANSAKDTTWIVSPKATALGKNGSMFMVAFNPTAQTLDDVGRAVQGTWKLSLQNLSAQPIEANVWVERNDMAYAEQRRQQTFLVNWDSAYVTSASTICSPASAKNAIAVGSHMWSTKRRSAYSAEGGPLGKSDPDASAPADVGDEIRGVRVEGVLSGSVTRTSGTSMAAPMVARSVANWMETQPSVNVDAIKAEAVRSFPVPPPLPQEP